MIVLQQMWSSSSQEQNMNDLYAEIARTLRAPGNCEYSASSSISPSPSDFRRPNVGQRIFGVELIYSFFLYLIFDIWQYTRIHR